MKYKATLFLTGGLGNQFYQYCALDMISKKLKYNPEIDLQNFNNNKNYKKLGIFKLFNNLNYDGIKNFNTKNYRNFLLKVNNKFPKISNLIFDKKFLNNKKDFEIFLEQNINKNIYINGYFQNHNIISNSNFGKYLKKRYKERNSHQQIGIHIRLGDYLLKPYSDIYWKFNEDYLKESFEIIKENYGNKFIKKVNIFSDSIEIAVLMAKKVLPSYVEVVPSKEKSVINDLFALSENKIKILSNSSFSLMSYYMNIGELTICPKRWFKNSQNTPDSLFPPNNYNGKFIKFYN